MSCRASAFCLPIRNLSLGVFAAYAVHAGQPIEPARNSYALEEWKLPVEAIKTIDGPLQRQCLLCHSMDYITTQPPLSAKQWSAIVDKMRGKFGAVIPTNQAPGLVDALVGAPPAVRSAVPEK